jgi:hypothetical protein
MQIVHKEASSRLQSTQSLLAAAGWAGVGDPRLLEPA